MTPQPPEHDFDRVDARPEGFVLRCACGWSSPPDSSAEAVGTAWDAHRRAEGAPGW